jgi:hypothetical protein
MSAGRSRIDRRRQTGRISQLEGTCFLRYQRHAGEAPLEERFESERRALVEAFAKLTHDFVHRVWIEDAGGHVLIGEADIRERAKKEVLT